MSTTWETLRTALTDAKAAEHLVRDGGLRSELARDPDAVRRLFRLARPERVAARGVRIIVRSSTTRSPALMRAGRQV